MGADRSALHKYTQILKYKIKRVNTTLFQKQPMGPNVFIYLFFFILALTTLTSSAQRLERKISSIERSLAMILDRLDIQAGLEISDRVRELALDPQRRLEALKCYRQETGAGLPEAKAVIDNLIANHRENTPK